MVSNSNALVPNIFVSLPYLTINIYSRYFKEKNADYFYSREKKCAITESSLIKLASNQQRKNCEKCKLLIIRKTWEK